MTEYEHGKMQTTEAYPPRSRFIGFIAVYGNVPTRRATTVSTSTKLKYRAYRSFHRRFYKRVSRNRPIKKKNVPTPIGSRYCTMQPESGLDKCILPFIFCSNACRTTRFETYMVTFVLILRNVSRISYENFIDNTDWLTENFFKNTFVLYKFNSSLSHGSN